MIKILSIVPMVLLLTACPGQIKVTPLDVSIALFEVDGKTSNLPGVPSIEADGCMLIIRNAELLKTLEPDTDSILKDIYMQTNDCTIGSPDAPPVSTGIRRDG